MKTSYDVIIVGGGGMGSATAYHIAQTKASVLLLEQFSFDHTYGSSNDHTRIIRYAYDNIAYIKLAQAVYPLWHDLETKSKQQLYQKTGGIDFGPSDEESLKNTLASLQAMNIPHHILSPLEASHRFPQFNFSDDWLIIHQPDSGILYAALCVKSHLELAKNYGAVLMQNTAVKEIIVSEKDVEVKTENEVFKGRRLVITAGPWAQTVLKQTGITLPIQPEACQLAYFLPNDIEAYGPQRFPVFIAHLAKQYGKMPYGIPNARQSGLKIAFHGGIRVQDASQINYKPSEEALSQIRKFIRAVIPTADGPLKQTRICPYTMSPDEHFIIDKHPQYPHISFAAGFSGHGFKFSALIGKIMRDLALDGSTEHDISLFSVNRFLD